MFRSVRTLIAFGLVALGLAAVSPVSASAAPRVLDLRTVETVQWDGGRGPHDGWGRRDRWDGGERWDRGRHYGWERGRRRGWDHRAQRRCITEYRNVFDPFRGWISQPVRRCW